MSKRIINASKETMDTITDATKFNLLTHEGLIHESHMISQEISGTTVSEQIVNLAESYAASESIILIDGMLSELGSERREQVKRLL